MSIMYCRIHCRQYDSDFETGTSLLATLNQMSAETASICVGRRCATLAAQVAHLTFYLESLEHYVAGQAVNKLAWSEIWHRVGCVTAAEWDAIRVKLAVTYRRLGRRLQGNAEWQHRDTCRDSMALLVYTTYYLGKIWQAVHTVAQVETEKAVYMIGANDE